MIGGYHSQSSQYLENMACYPSSGKNSAQGFYHSSGIKSSSNSKAAAGSAYGYIGSSQSNKQLL